MQLDAALRVHSVGCASLWNVGETLAAGRLKTVEMALRLTIHDHRRRATVTVPLDHVAGQGRLSSWLRDIKHVVTMRLISSSVSRVAIRVKTATKVISSSRQVAR